MLISFYTSRHYFDAKKQAVEEAAKKLGLEAEVVLDESFTPKAPQEQTFGFEELFKMTKTYASAALRQGNADIGIGIENSLSFIFSAKEWYYVICIALETKNGKSTATFTPGISVPLWMVKEVQDNKIKIDAVTQRLAGEDDPVVFFSGGTLSRKDIMMPALLLAFSNLGLEKHS